MEKETRIYLADLSSWYNSSSDLENVVECAESQGTVYTFENFVDAWNNGEISELDKEDVVMAIGIIENGVLVEGYTSN